MMDQTNHRHGADPASTRLAPQLPPSSDWNSLPELPTSAELNPDSWSQAEEPLSRNDVTQPYESKEDYIGTHYRLNREESITFLRFGVSRFRRNPLMLDDEHTCVYTKVFVQGYTMSRLGSACKIQFSTERAGKKIRWSTSRRLIPGSLVALSTAADNFSTICKPAVVADRSIKDGLEQNPATISLFWANMDDMVLDPTLQLVMIESRSGYFEAVKHTLTALQDVARNEHSLLKYLVRGSRDDSTPQHIMKSSTMDLTPLLDHTLGGNTENEHMLSQLENCDVLGGLPRDVQLHTTLDRSQLEAVQRVLTKELSLVQGPPGTGKTYTSVQALRCMVHSSTGGLKMKPDKLIIVAAETNHALDQLLSHLIEANINVVRLGGRSSDENIKKYSLFNLRRQANISRGQDMINSEAARDKKIRELKSRIGEVFPDGLVQPETLLAEGIISKEQFESLEVDACEYAPTTGHPGGPLAEWLGKNLQDLTLLKTHDPIFDNEEAVEDDLLEGTDGSDFESNDEDVSKGDDDGYLRGPWLGFCRRWGGARYGCLDRHNAQVHRQSRKKDLWDIDEKWRGMIYENWVVKLLAIRKETMLALFINHDQLCKDIKLYCWKRDINFLRAADTHIVGCTTTGLSKYRGLLAGLEPRIILIEEAAQSREAHIAAALLPTVQQLILVGDHQQLVPHCDVPGLTDDFHNLTVSMFERLVSYLRLPYSLLNRQRRMIPDIRAVLNPFYPTLGDHPTVLDKRHRPDVPGVAVNSYLFHHNWEESTDLESFSKYNLKEAEMVIQYAIYLIHNGTAAHRITILTFYRGQRKKVMFLARKHMTPLFGHANITVSTVDSYQGEENDIVLLSLVRSNAGKQRAVAGFVGDMNRGIVAISRARRGLYIFGNVHNLEIATEVSKFMWQSVRLVFEKLDCYATDISRLPLRCTNHGNITYVAEVDDFRNPLGGCMEQCTAVFGSCGHPCGRRCHPMSHDELICQQICQRKLQCGHGCSKACGKECQCAQNCVDFLTSRRRAGETTNEFRPSLSADQNNMATPARFWNDFDAALDDANIRKALKAVEHSQTAPSTPKHIRDEHHPISVDRQGKRKLSSSNSLNKNEKRSQLSVEARSQYSHQDNQIGIATPEARSNLAFRPGSHSQAGIFSAQIDGFGAQGQGGKDRRGTSHNVNHTHVERDQEQQDMCRTDGHGDPSSSSMLSEAFFKVVSQNDDSGYVVSHVRDWEEISDDELPPDGKFCLTAMGSIIDASDDCNDDLITL